MATSLEEELDVDIEVDAQQLLLAAAHHDLESLRTLLRSVSANVKDADTGFTALHTAIAACGPDIPFDAQFQANGNAVEAPDQDEDPSLVPAEKTLKLLFQNGAIWNDLDGNNETPGCLAWRLELRSLYEIVVDAGVRAELLLNRLDEYEPLPDVDDDEDEDEEQTDGDLPVEQETSRSYHERQENIIPLANEQISTATATTPANSFLSQPNAEPNTLNENYLASPLSFNPSSLLDSSANGVMMSWESKIMQCTASILLPTPGLRILNIGFGMGIFDTLAQTHSPSSHHIVEAHPNVLSRMQEMGWVSEDLASSGSSTPSAQHNVTVHPGRWQDVLPALIASDPPVLFDAIFFDTFAESYSAFRHFFTEHVIALLAPSGAWSFFHGLGADRQVCYDVYTKIVEMDLFEAGFDVDWEKIPTTVGDGEWDATRRRYWNVSEYRLPMCRFVE